MVSVVELDVSTLEPPQPMREISQLLVMLPKGQVLHVTHRRKPEPFLEMLDSEFAYLHFESRPGYHHIWFWHSDDKDAEDHVRDLFHEIDRA